MLNSNHERWGKLGAEDKGYYFEFIVESAINSIVRNGDTCIDVGVNFGAHAFTMLRCVGSDGSVIGFEPNPTCCKMLSEWPSHGKNFFLHNVALSDSEGEAELHIAPANEISTLHPSVLTRLDMREATLITVPLKRLDDFRLKSCRLIKIDVDGEEFRCLRGGLKQLLGCDLVCSLR